MKVPVGHPMEVTSAVALQKEPAGHTWGSDMATKGQTNPNGQGRAKYVPEGQKFDATHDTHEFAEGLK